jgi:hypothetical protein
LPEEEVTRVSEIAVCCAVCGQREIGIIRHGVRELTSIERDDDDDSGNIIAELEVVSGITHTATSIGGVYITLEGRCCNKHCVSLD